MSVEERSSAPAGRCGPQKEQEGCRRGESRHREICQRPVRKISTRSHEGGVAVIRSSATKIVGWPKITIPAVRVHNIAARIGVEGRPGKSCVPVHNAGDLPAPQGSSLPNRALRKDGGSTRHRASRCA